MAETDFSINPFADTMQGMFAKDQNNFAIDDGMEQILTSVPLEKENFETTMKLTSSTETLKSVTVDNLYQEASKSVLISSSSLKKLDIVVPIFDISLSDPQKVGDKLSSYILYLLTVKVIC